MKRSGRRAATSATGAFPAAAAKAALAEAAAAAAGRREKENRPVSLSRTREPFSAISAVSALEAFLSGARTERTGPMKRTSLLSMPFAALLVLCAATAASGMYHPTLGRFVQRDPVGYVDADSLYTTVYDNPIAFLDPYGLSSQAGESGGGACCCAGDPSKCVIEVRFAARRGTKGVNVMPMRTSEGKLIGAKTVSPSGKGVVDPDTMMQNHARYIDVGGAQGMEIRGGDALVMSSEQRVSKYCAMMMVYATVTLYHKEGKDVTGCHLAQEVESMDSGGAIRALRLEPEIGGDKSGSNPTYHDWWYTDAPGFAVQSDQPPVNASFSRWWQAHVYVKETTKVETWWGWSGTILIGATLRMDDRQHSFEGWKDQKKEPYFALVGEKSQTNVTLRTKSTAMTAPEINKLWPPK